MAITIPIYTGNIPNQLGDSRAEFSTNTQDFVNYFGGQDSDDVIPKINEAVTQMNVDIADAENYKNLAQSAASTASASANAALYSDVTTYDTGDTVIGSNGYAYRCLTDGVLDDDPVSSLTENWALVDGPIYRNILANMSVRNWSSTTSPEQNDFSSNCFSPELGLFIAVSSTGTNRVFKSSDGINYTAVTAPVAAYQDVCWEPTIAGGLFYVVGPNTVITSPDGDNWTARTPAAANTWVAVTSGLGKIVAIASDGTLADQIMVSTDGVTWSSRTITNSTVNPWESLCFSKTLGRFLGVASGGTSRAITSDNGNSWFTNQLLGGDIQWSSCSRSDELGLFCVVARSGASQIATTPDGVTWTYQTVPEANAWERVIYAPELALFCAVSTNGTNQLMTSDNGLQFIARNLGNSAAHKTIAWGNTPGIFSVLASSGTNRVTSSL